MKNNPLSRRRHRTLLVFVLWICCTAYIHAQTVYSEKICEGETINFDGNYTGGITGEGTPDGWYVNDKKEYDGAFGFIHSPTSNTTYTLRLTTGETRVTVFVTVYPTPILVIDTPGEGESRCSGGSVPLYARVTNSASTEIYWTCNGWQYGNGSMFTPPSVGAHTITATARNMYRDCPTVSDDRHITVTFEPSRAQGEQSAATYCSKSTVNLNDCMGFSVRDTYGNHDKADSHAGTITWYAWTGSNYMPVADPEHVQLTSLRDTAFFADLSSVTVTYANTCNGTPFKQTLSSDTRQYININVVSDRFEIDNYYVPAYPNEGYFYSMCAGDSVQAVFKLTNENGEPSSCGTIAHLGVLSSHTPIREVKTSGTIDTLVFAPFTGLKDTIEISAESSTGVKDTFKLYLRPPAAPSTLTQPVCKNTSATFLITVDHCDTIRNITCDISGATITDKSLPQQWCMRVPDLPGEVLVSCSVTYYSKLKGKDITEQIDVTLSVHKDPPRLLVYLAYDHSYSGFDNTTQNLCLDDSLHFHFHMPNDCDTIVDIRIQEHHAGALQDAGTLSAIHDQDKHNRHYFIKPPAEGAYTYQVTMTYRRPKEPPISTAFSYTVEVKQAPRLFINPEPDTLRYCYSPTQSSDHPPLDLTDLDDLSYALIDYSVVDRAMWENGSNTFTPTTTRDYWITAYYTYSCSGRAAYDSDKVHILVSDKSDDGTAFIQSRPPEGFCLTPGITIESIDKPGSELTWEHDGNPVTFPYSPAAGTGTYDIIMKVKNACFPDKPYTYTVKDVIVVPLPEVKAAPPLSDTVCRGATVTLKPQPGYIGNLVWTESPSGTTVPNPDKVTIYETTTFRVTAHNAACGFSPSDNEITIYRMPDAAMQLMPDTSVCKNDKIHLHAAYNATRDRIAWHDARGNILNEERPEIQVTATETYWATVENRCGNTTAALTVTMLKLPYVKVKEDTTICYGESLNFSQCVIGSAISTRPLQWEPDYNVITRPVVYHVTASTEKCGSAKDTIYVNAYPPLILLPEGAKLPPYKVSLYNPYYREEDFYDVSFQTLQGTPPLSYSISGTLPTGLGIINERLSGKPDLRPGDYNTHLLQVRVTDGHNCKISREYILAPEWKAPNTLLPMENFGNGNSNAVFLPDYELEVYTRNGQLVHKGTGWDGRWNNVHVPPGTYFYKAKVLFDGKTEERMGYVVIMYY
ncbi:MAG: gliding motility-associated C-terminal domain-containing protein [Prevotellaceae bacterium]|jgi:hypothetical protein|nr:gliding motility-associated C-terminal domain-containing protein [Prevotellaceae bacterium]